MFLKRKPKDLWHNKVLKILLFTNGLILLSAAMLGPIYALFVEEIGGDLLDASFAGAAFAIGAGVTSLLIGKWGDKSPCRGWWLGVGYLIMAVGFLAYLWVDSVKWLLCVQLFLGFGEALYAPIFDALYSEHLDKGKASSEWGAWECMNYWTAAFGSLVGGYVAFNHGFYWLFVIMALVSFLSAGLVFSFRGRLN